MQRPTATFLLFALLLFAGCGSGVELHPVEGTVKFADGTIPKGDVATVTFQPAELGQAGTDAPRRKGASGAISPEDGSYQLRTGPEPGAMPGKYKVLITVIENHMKPNERRVVHEKYARPETTPFSVEVPGDEGDFDFTVDKP